jgi:hypothetical protein
MFPIPLHMYFEAGALFASAALWPHLRTLVLRWFLPYLIFIICIELIGRYIGRVLQASNSLLFNFSIPIEYLFFAFIFLKSYSRSAYRFLAMWFLILFSIFAAINITVNGLEEFHTNVLIIGSFSMIIFSVLYFINLYQDMETEIVWKEPMFWIAAGVLLFNMGEFVYNFLSGYLIRNGFDEAAVIFRSINNKLILVLYSFLIIGFLCARNTRNLMKA